MRAWSAGVQALARCPNVFMKLGGLGMPINGFDYHTAPMPPTLDSSSPRTGVRSSSRASSAFGAARCMFESNFPVDKAMCSYPVLWNAFKRIAAGASASEKSALFHDTATDCYRLAP